MYLGFLWFASAGWLVQRWHRLMVYKKLVWIFAMHQCMQHAILAPFSKFHIVGFTSRIHKSQQTAYLIGSETINRLSGATRHPIEATREKWGEWGFFLDHMVFVYIFTEVE
jgi:hypothetical protein